MASYPHDALIELHADVTRKLEDEGRYNDLQRAELHETLAIAYFYGGNYTECLQGFESALKQRKSVPSYDLPSNDRSLPRIHTLAGIACYRRGEFYAAQNHFQKVAKIPRIRHTNIDLYCQSKSNLALVHLQLQKPESAKNTALDAVKAGENHNNGVIEDFDDDNDSQVSDNSSRMSIAKSGTASSVSKGSVKKGGKKGANKKAPKSPPAGSGFHAAIAAEPVKRVVRLVDHVRVALLVYLRVGSPGEAMKMLRDNDKLFKHKEFKLLEAGCAVADGKFADALSTLQQPDPQASEDAYTIASVTSAVAKLKAADGSPGNGKDAPYSISRQGSIKFTSRGPSRQGSISSLIVEPTEQEIADALAKLTRAYADEKVKALEANTKYNEATDDSLFDAMKHFNIHSLRTYELNQMPSDKSDDDNEKALDHGDTSSSLGHLKQALDLLNTTMADIKAEREFLEQRADDTTSMALFQCPIPETTLSSLVALSYVAMTTAESMVENLVFIDGLHMQFGSIMNSIESALVRCEPVKAIHKDAHHHHRHPPDEDIFHKHGTRTLRSLSHHDPTLAHHHDTPDLCKHMTTDYHINTTGDVNTSVSSLMITRTPVASEVITHLQHANNKEHGDNSNVLMAKHHTDVVKSVLMLLDYSFAVVHDLIGNTPGDHHNHHHHGPGLHGQGAGGGDHIRSSLSVSGDIDDHSLQIQPQFDTVVADYAVDSYRSVVALMLGGYDDAANHVAHVLKKRFGHIVPARLGGKKKIVAVINGKLKAEEAASVSSAYTSKDGHGQTSYHDLFENTTVRSEIFPLGTLIENKQKTADEIIMAQIASNGNVGKPLFTNPLGVEEINYWLQWALLITDVPGYGFMGYSNHQMDNNLDHLTQDAVKEVFNNIQNIYQEICNNSSIYSSSIATVLNNNAAASHDATKTDQKDLNNPTFSNTSPNSYIGMKLIYVAALIKLASYINAGEIGLYVKEFQKLAETMNDAAFLALAYRFMMDFDEYEYSRKKQAEQFAYNKAHPPAATPTPMSPGGQLTATERELMTPGGAMTGRPAPVAEPYKIVVRPLGELQAVLKNAKKYRQYAQHTNDNHMKRDAIKRQMNIYLDIHQTQLAHGRRRRGDDDDEKHRTTGIEAELKGLSADAIDRKEQMDVAWLGKVAHIRAKAMYVVYKEFSIVLAAPPNQSTTLFHRLMEICHDERSPLLF